MIVRRWAAAVLAVSLVGSIPADASAVAAERSGRSLVVTTTERTIAPGLVYRKIVDPTGPWVIHELDVDPAETLTLDTLSAGRMGTWARTKTMAAGSGALAAINGDFSVWPGRAIHPFVDDGSLKESGLQAGGTFGIDQAGAPRIRHGHVVISATDQTSGAAADVASWNAGPPRLSAIAGFTPFGGTVEQPPVMACSARLAPAGKMQLDAAAAVFLRDYTVLMRRCRTARVPVLARTIVLSSKLGGAGSTWIKGLRKGHVVRVRWDGGLNGAPDVIGGAPILVRGGKVVADPSCTTWFCRNNPRTGVGYTADGHVLMVAVDGRTTTSVGMAIVRFAQEMRSLGATDALNLDGGGSSTMWIRGVGIVNVPSDTAGERPVTNALAVLPVSDG